MAGSDPQPDRPLYVVGDIHGREDLLDAVLRLITRDAVKAGCGSQADLVFVGDYIDRGPDSRNVVTRLMGLTKETGMTVTCLMGNHEAMCLAFLAEQEESGSLWLSNGGRETLQSYGVFVPLRLPDAAAQNALRKLARRAIPTAHLDWLRSLPTLWTSGDVVVVHAAFDPDQTREDQRQDTLIWGRSAKFLKTRRDSGPWVVHGHTITRPLAVHGRRIPVDGGAYAFDVLSAAVLVPGCPVRYLSTAD
ncbi:hypothetical protein BV911_06395 [Pseudoruegeria sp. SK021]|nr:hypothetical protein BV911_06395 [Pseudoruegeria sp. SK021]